MLPSRQEFKIMGCISLLLFYLASTSLATVRIQRAEQAFEVGTLMLAEVVQR